ncbi:MAG: hypothetical protein WAL50_17770, partial [Kineosporiaceae bacterium]
MALAVGALVVAPTNAAAGTLTGHGHGPTSDAVVRWNAQAGKAAVAACIAPLENPLHESRAYAMMHIAVHDALNAIDRRYEPYAYRGHADPHASADAAVAAAARGVLVPTLRAI